MSSEIRKGINDRLSNNTINKHTSSRRIIRISKAAYIVEEAGVIYITAQIPQGQTGLTTVLLHRDEVCGAEVCWDKEGGLKPVSLEDMNEEEKEVRY